MTRKHPKRNEIKEIFSYCTSDNLIRIKKNKMGYDGVGKIAGCKVEDAYWILSMDANNYFLHRLIWIYHNGDIPNKMLIDHIDGDKHNNKIENLRLATQAQNQRHRIKLPSHNTTGYMGVRQKKNRFYAHITKHGKQISCGAYATAIDAAKARDEAVLKSNDVFMYLNFPQGD